MARRDNDAVEGVEEWTRKKVTISDDVVDGTKMMAKNKGR